MHEMSIALNILDIVKEEAKKANAGKVIEVVLEIGTLSGIEAEALDFALQSCSTEPLMANCSVKMQMIKAIASCNDCSNKFHADNLYTTCPDCGSYSSNIICGQEMRVKSIIVD